MANSRGEGEAPRSSGSKLALASPPGVVGRFPRRSLGSPGALPTSCLGYTGRHGRLGPAVLGFQGSWFSPTGKALPSPHPSQASRGPGRPLTRLQQMLPEAPPHRTGRGRRARRVERGVGGRRPARRSPHASGAAGVRVPWGSRAAPRCWPRWRCGVPRAGPAAAASSAPAAPRRPRGARAAARGGPWPRPRPSAWRRPVLGSWQRLSASRRGARACSWGRHGGSEPQRRGGAAAGAAWPPVHVCADAPGAVAGRAGRWRGRGGGTAPVPAGRPCGFPSRAQCPRCPRRRQINPPSSPSSRAPGGGLTR